MPRPKKSLTKRSNLRRPRHATAADLGKAGVTLVDGHRFLLMCDACGQTWSPAQPSAGARLHHGYWRCPNSCNAAARR